MNRVCSIKGEFMNKAWPVIGLFLLAAKNDPHNGSAPSGTLNINSLKNDTTIVLPQQVQKTYAKVAFSLHSQGALTTINSVAFTDLAGKVTTLIAGNSNTKDISIKRICPTCEAFPNAELIGEDDNQDIFSATKNDVFYIETEAGDILEKWRPIDDGISSVKILFEEKADATAKDRINDGNHALMEQLRIQKFGYL